MNHDAELFADFSQEMLNRGLTPLSEEQFQLLREHHRNHPRDWLEEKLGQLRDDDPEAIESVEKWASVAKLTTGLNLLQLPVDLRGSIQLIREHGRERMMNLLTNARKGQDPSHKNELRKMVNAQLDLHENGHPPAEPAAAPTERRQPPTGQSRPLGQMPPPPGTQSRRAYPRSVEGNGAAVVRQAAPRHEERQVSRSRPPQDRSNVAQFDQERRQQRHRPADAYEPADARCSEGTDEGAEAPRTYDSATAFNRGNKGCAVRFQNAQDTRKADRVRHVVFVESAPINPQTRTTYLWDQKVVLMLNQAETEQALLVMYGLLPSARFTAHGQDKKGWMQISTQDPDDRYAGCIQVQVGRGSGTLTTNIFPTQLTDIKAVVLRAYLQMFGFDSMDAALRHLHMSSSSYALFAKASQQRETQPRRAYSN